jgi:hypothetical protein
MSERRCRVCGCTQNRACDTFDGACHWIAEDLCSACDPAIGGSDSFWPGGPMVPTGVTRLSGNRIERVNTMKHLSELDFEALTLVEPIAFELNGEQALALLTLLQLAVRHPQLPRMGEPVQVCLKEMGNALTNYMSKVSAGVFDVAVSGWQDGKVPEVSRIILPH